MFILSCGHGALRHSWVVMKRFLFMVAPNCLKGLSRECVASKRLFGQMTENRVWNREMEKEQREVIFQFPFLRTTIQVLYGWNGQSPGTGATGANPWEQGTSRCESGDISNHEVNRRTMVTSGHGQLVGATFPSGLIPSHPFCSGLRIRHEECLEKDNPIPMKPCRSHPILMGLCFLERWYLNYGCVKDVTSQKKNRPICSVETAHYLGLYSTLWPCHSTTSTPPPLLGPRHHIGVQEMGSESASDTRDSLWADLHVSILTFIWILWWWEWNIRLDLCKSGGLPLSYMLVPEHF